MSMDYQPMETGESEEKIKVTKKQSTKNKINNSGGNNNKTINLNGRCISNLSVQELAVEYKYILIYIGISFLITFYVFTKSTVFGLINLLFLLLGSGTMFHGINNKQFKFVNIGTACYIFYMGAILVESLIVFIRYFGEIFFGDGSAFVDLLKFIGVTVLLLIFLSASGYFTYKILQLKREYCVNGVQISSAVSTYKEISASKSKIKMTGTVELNNNK